MPVYIFDTLDQFMGGTFPLVNAEDVAGAFNDRGDATTASTTYTTEDVVRLADGRFRKCIVAGDYTAVEIGADTTNWQTFGSNTGGLVRYDDHGTPPTAPTEEGQVAVDRGGRVYPAGDEVVTHDTPPTITRTEISNADWTFWNNVHDIAPGAIGTDGHFFFSSRSHYFFQNQGTLGVVQVRWDEAVSYLAGLGEIPPVDLQGRTWLGFFGAFEDAAEHLARISFRNARDWIFVKEGDPGEGLYIVTAHADTGQVRQDNLFWNPSLVSLSDVLDAADGTPGSLAKIQSYGAFTGRVLAVLDGRVEIPIADASLENRLLWNPYNDRLEVCVDNPSVSGTVATGTFGDIPTRADLYVAEFRTNISGQSVGDYAYDIEAGHFYEWAPVFAAGNEWRQTSAAVALAASRSNLAHHLVWLGSFDADADALNEIVSQGGLRNMTDYFYDRGRVIRRLDLATWVPPNEQVSHWEWISVAEQAARAGENIQRRAVVGYHSMNRTITNITTASARRVGNIYQNGERTLRITEVEMPVTPASTADYELQFAMLTRESDSSYRFIDGTLQSVDVGEAVGGTETILQAVPTGGWTVPPDAYFFVGALIDAVANAQPYANANRDIVDTPQAYFAYVAEGSNDDTIPAANAQFYRNANFAVRMEIVTSTFEEAPVDRDLRAYGVTAGLPDDLGTDTGRLRSECRETHEYLLQTLGALEREGRGHGGDAKQLAHSYVGRMYQGFYLVVHSTHYGTNTKRRFCARVRSGPLDVTGTDPFVFYSRIESSVNSPANPTGPVLWAGPNSELSYPVYQAVAHFASEAGLNRVSAGDLPASSIVDGNWIGDLTA